MPLQVPRCILPLFREEMPSFTPPEAPVGRPNTTSRNREWTNYRPPSLDSRAHWAVAGRNLLAISRTRLTSATARSTSLLAVILRMRVRLP